MGYDWEGVQDGASRVLADVLLYDMHDIYKGACHTIFMHFGVLFCIYVSFYNEKFSLKGKIIIIRNATSNY